LALKSTQLGDHGVAAMSASAEHLKQLTYLDLSHNDISCMGGGDFAGFERCVEQLQHLDMSHNNIGDEGVNVVVSGQGWQQLHALDLSHNNIDKVGALAVANAARGWRQLQFLDLRHNKANSLPRQLIFRLPALRLCCHCDPSK
jgi:Ran GTPase-activating protein (RanGAP) involved in mRNA processing and transport